MLGHLDKDELELNIVVYSRGLDTIAAPRSEQGFFFNEAMDLTLLDRQARLESTTHR